MIKTVWGSEWFPDEYPPCGHTTYEELLDRVKNGDERYAGSLGWTDIRGRCTDEWLVGLTALAAEVREEADVFVLVGVGGSNNAARAVIKALNPPGVETIYAGNTLSPYEMGRVLARLEGKSVYINVIAKNFETLEPGLAFRVLRAYLEKRYGAAVAKRIIVTGTRGSLLEKLCVRQGYRFLEFPEEIGGRYSAVSEVGLFPMAVAGADIRALVHGAAAQQEEILSSGRPDNEALRYAVGRNFLYRRGYQTELMAVFEPRLQWFEKWWAQLFAESEGKQQKGIFPAGAVCTEDLHSIGQFVQEGTPALFETFLDAGDGGDAFCVPPDAVGDGFGYLDGKSFREINRAAQKATYGAHTQNLPCMRIQTGGIDEETFGRLFVFFEYACYYSCLLMKVNPFDQPGVEAYKQRMFRALGKA